MKLLKASLMLCIMLCLNLALSAQSKSPFNQKKGIAHETEIMAQDLNLTPAQKVKVQALNEERAERRAEIRAELKGSIPKTADKPTPAAKAKAKEQRKAMRKNYRQKLKGILTPAQFEKWKELKAEKKAQKGK